MTRKSFKKLCMGLGLKPKHADMYAYVSFVLFGSYAKAWESVQAAFPECKPPVMPLPEKEVQPCE